MSNSKQSGTTGPSGDAASAPRAVIHKQILDVAAANPTSSIDELAAEVSGASADLVERVLDEYGDPGGDASGDSGPSTTHVEDGDVSSADGGTAPANETDATDEHDPAATDGSADHGSPAGTKGAMSEEDTDTTASFAYLDETDRRLLAAVADRPEATQQTIADALGVSRATISRRVSDIDGLEWRTRVPFVDGFAEELDAVEVPDAVSTSTDQTTTVAMSTSDADVQVNDAGTKSGTSEGDDARDATESPADTGAVEDGDTAGGLADRVDAVETRLDDLGDVDHDGDTGDATASDDGAVFDDPELVHKVVHACLESDRISEDEELRILASILDGDRTA